MQFNLTTSGGGYSIFKTIANKQKIEIDKRPLFDTGIGPPEGGL